MSANLVERGFQEVLQRIAGLVTRVDKLERTSLGISGGISSGGVSLSDNNPEPLGTAAPGDGTQASRDDHIHAIPSLLDLSDTPNGYDDTKFLASTASGTQWAVPAGGASLSNNNPLALSTADPGDGTAASRDDHVHPTTDLALASHTHTREAVFTFATEALEDGMASVFRLYNTSGASRTITKVYASVGEAPGGQEIIVDVKLNDVSIFSVEANRPQIAVSAFYGSSTLIGTTTWGADQYLTAHVPQAGTTTAGANLVVYVLYTG